MNSKANNFKEKMLETSLVWNNISNCNIPEMYEKPVAKELPSGTSTAFFSTRSQFTNNYLSESDFYATATMLGSKKVSSESKKFLICPFCFRSYL